MIGLLVLIAIGFVVYQLFATGARFLPQFARLLTSPRLERDALSVLAGRSYLTGRFRDRDVAIRLQSKRTRYGQGYLVIAMRTGIAVALTYDDIDARVSDDVSRRALASLAANDLILTLDEGWLKALWRPQGFVIFPGRFSEERWRRTLVALAELADALDAT